MGVISDMLVPASEPNVPAPLVTGDVISDAIVLPSGPPDHVLPSDSIAVASPTDEETCHGKRRRILKKRPDSHEQLFALTDAELAETTDGLSDSQVQRYMDDPYSFVADEHEASGAGIDEVAEGAGAEEAAEGNVEAEAPMMECGICLEPFENDGQWTEEDYPVTLDCGHTYHSYCISQWGYTAGKAASQIGCPVGCHKEPITISDAAPDLSSMSTMPFPGMPFPVAPAVVFTATAEEDPSGAAQVAEPAVRVSPPSEKQQLQQRALAVNQKRKKTCEPTSATCQYQTRPAPVRARRAHLRRR